MRIKLNLLNPRLQRGRSRRIGRDPTLTPSSCQAWLKFIRNSAYVSSFLNRLTFSLSLVAEMSMLEQSPK